MFRFHTHGLIALAGVLLRPSAAISAKDKKRDNDPATMSDRGQSRLTREVRHELVMLPYYGVFDNLAYRVDGSTVTLFGQVTRPTLKSDAEKAVKDVEGVSRVVNNIEVLPVGTNDDQIRLATYRAIYGAPALARY